MTRYFALLIALIGSLAGCAGLLQKDHQKGELIVGYRAGTKLAQQDSINTHYGFTVLSRLSHLRADHVQLSKGTQEAAIVDSLKACPLIEYVELNFFARPQNSVLSPPAPLLLALADTMGSFTSALPVTPNDSLYRAQWGLPKVSAPAAWSTVSRADSIVLAIMDSGIDPSHPDLTANLWTSLREIPDNNLDDDGNGYKDDWRGWDFAAGFWGDNDPSDTPNGGFAGHGTHVAGIAGAVGNNRIGVSGAAWSVRLMPLKIFSDYSSGGTVTMAVKALTYATQQRVHVVNTSFLLAGYSVTVERAIQMANTFGILLVCAAGNGNADLDRAPVYPPCHNAPNILVVGAVDANDGKSGFSNYGKTSVDLAAPGRDIRSTKRGGAYESRTGTSQAAPLVAGAAALLYQRLAQRGQLTGTAQDAARVKAALLAGVDPVPSWAGKSVSGGRLNVAKALAHLEGGTP